MISSNPMRALALTAAAFGCAVAQADECDTMTKTVEVMIDKLDPPPRPATTLPACAPLMARASD
jgi:hypothetical protein